MNVLYVGRAEEFGRLVRGDDRAVQHMLRQHLGDKSRKLDVRKMSSIHKHVIFIVRFQVHQQLFQRGRVDRYYCVHRRVRVKVVKGERLGLEERVEQFRRVATGVRGVVVRCRRNLGERTAEQRNGLGSEPGSRSGSEPGSRSGSESGLGGMNVRVFSVVVADKPLYIHILAIQHVHQNRDAQHCRIWYFGLCKQ